MTKKTALRSPCIGICAVSGKTGFCIGCGRKLAEIAGWARLNDDERTQIMQELPTRLALSKTAS